MKRLNGICVAATRQTDPFAETRSFPLPDKVVLPLDSPWGRLSSLVQPGERVRAGQRIAEDPKGLIPPLRASVSGAVRQIRRWPGAFGQDLMALVIESDGEEEIKRLFEDEGPGQDPKAILNLISEAGIREVDPYTWPLAWRIAQPSIAPQIAAPIAPELRRPIEYLIINGIDRQPGVALREQVLLSEASDLLESIKALQTVSGARKTILAVCKDLPLPEVLEHGLRSHWVEIARLPRKYPIGLEPILVQSITGREVPQPDGDSRAVGAVVVDVTAALRALHAVRDGIPAVENFFQISAPARGLNAYVRVREGVLLEAVLQDFSAADDNLSKIVMGGPFLGHAHARFDIPVTQETDAVLLQEKEEVASYANEPCINCGLCVRNCPMRLMPNELGKYCEYGKFPAAEKVDIFNCIECGICAYVCPVKRPMLHLIRFGKKELLNEAGAE